jgi:deoxyribonuclease IV
MRTIGLHLRIGSDLSDIARQALNLGLRSFQCFLLHQKTGKHIEVTSQQTREFLSLRHQFDTLYIHGAYWINLCALRCNGSKYLFSKELSMAKRLGFTHYILHPGSAKGWDDRLDSIDYFVKTINEMMKHEHDITLVLENTAHGAKTIGSDLHDFKIIREKIDYPEKVLFCIDTAHAYAFGYDISDVEKHQEIIAFIDDVMGVDAISLIHLNDTQEERGLKLDKHVVLGEGNIGLVSLKQFVLNKQLARIPLIMELPSMEEGKQHELIGEIKSWHSKKENCP